MKFKLLIGCVLVIWHCLAHAEVQCTNDDLRYAGSNNTLYIQGGAICRVADIANLKPKLMVEQNPGVYLLKANIKIVDGSVFLIDGDDSSLPTLELRLLSNNTNLPNSVVNLTADYGIIQINNTKVLSWDEAAQGPDTDYVTGNRAYIRVRSSTIENQSRMDVIDSDVSYLGYYSSESYGLTWKVSGTLNDVSVYGYIINSHIHHNYFGVYTYGAKSMMISGNEFNSNIKYGLDPHDDSDYLTIINNSSHDNGDHGIICSQRCNNLIVRYNNSYNNAGHGIMFHRSVDNSIIEYNNIFNNADTGIALFESNNNIVRGNLIQGNKNGIRLSVGSSSNRFFTNIILGSLDNSIYTYKGTDLPVRDGNDGVNMNNIWMFNKVSSSGSYVLKLNATDGDLFSFNDFTGNENSQFLLKGASNTKFNGNLVDFGSSLH